MNYYQHHIGDFNSATRHLTRVERSLYRDLIELYYDTENPLDGDKKKLARKVMARSEEEIEALSAVLSEFFTLHNDQFHQDRCDDEIIKYRENSSAKARAGKASAEARKKKRELEKQHNLTRVEQVSSTCATELQQNPTNHKPITNNQEPLTNNQLNTTASSPPDWMDGYVGMFWESYPKKVDKKKTIERLRKMIKAKPDREHFAMIMDKVLKKSLVTEKQFWPSPDRYLRDEKWEDEIISEVKHGQYQQPNQPKPSLIDRVKAGAEQRERERAARAGREFNGQGMDKTNGDVRPQVHQPVRGDGGRYVGNLLEGDYTETSS